MVLPCCGFFHSDFLFRQSFVLFFSAVMARFFRKISDMYNVNPKLVDRIGTAATIVSTGFVISLPFSDLNAINNLKHEVATVVKNLNGQIAILHGQIENNRRTAELERQKIEFHLAKQDEHLLKQDEELKEIKGVLATVVAELQAIRLATHQDGKQDK